MPQNPTDLKNRTKAFALRIIRLYQALPKSGEAQVIGKQILRSGTSVGAHYREACRAKSPADFISKIEGGLQKEANELTAIFVASVKTTKKNRST